jgi:hypothetical protein
MADDRVPTLAEQMAAQARIREAGKPDTQVAVGCLAWLGVVMAGILAWVVISGAALAWWMWLQW